MATRLTSHFNLEEFYESSTATANGIDNAPPSDIHSNILYCAVNLEFIRSLYNSPIRITSGYRCSQLNKLVGGSSKSNHLKGLAVDINNGTIQNAILYNLLQRLKSILPITELINERNYSWIHVSFKQP